MDAVSIGITTGLTWVTKDVEEQTMQANDGAGLTPHVQPIFMLNIRWMMDVVFHDGCRCLWRDVKMPALPPVRCVVSTPAVEYDCIDVKKIWYMESLQLFVVEFEMYDIKTCMDMNLAQFEVVGWKESRVGSDWADAAFSA